MDRQIDRYRQNIQMKIHNGSLIDRKLKDKWGNGWGRQKRSAPARGN